MEDNGNVVSGTSDEQSNETFEAHEDKNGVDPGEENESEVPMDVTTSSSAEMAAALVDIRLKCNKCGHDQEVISNRGSGSLNTERTYKKPSSHPSTLLASILKSCVRVTAMKQKISANCAFYMRCLFIYVELTTSNTIYTTNNSFHTSNENLNRNIRINPENSLNLFSLDHSTPKAS